MSAALWAFATVLDPLQLSSTLQLLYSIIDLFTIDRSRTDPRMLMPGGILVRSSSE